MSTGPEANFWKSIRRNLPSKWFATRIENKHGGGIPDVHIVADGVPFWVELKTIKSNAINLSAHQVAWNMAYWARGGANFFLVKDLSFKKLYLFKGNQGPSLTRDGLNGTEGHEYGTVKDALEALRPHAASVLGLDL